MRKNAKRRRMSCHGLSLEVGQKEGRREAIRYKFDPLNGSKLVSTILNLFEFQIFQRVNFLDFGGRGPHKIDFVLFQDYVSKHGQTSDALSSPLNLRSGLGYHPRHSFLFGLLDYLLFRWLLLLFLLHGFSRGRASSHRL